MGNLVPRLFPLPWHPDSWVLTNKINVEDVLKIDSCSCLAWCREESIMFSSKQTHMFDYFICYHLESGWHVTRPNQALSLGRGECLGARLVVGLVLKGRGNDENYKLGRGQ